MKHYYKDALYLAAEMAYRDEIFDTGMESLTIGEGNEFENESDWIASRVSEWLEDAARIRAEKIDE